VWLDFFACMWAIPVRLLGLQAKFERVGKLFAEQPNHRPSCCFGKAVLSWNGVSFLLSRRLLV